MWGKKHPLLEHCPPLAPQLEWLQAAFLRLHRRRHHSDSGLQPLSHQDMTHFAQEVLGLDRPTSKITVRILEATDNAVLYDFYEQQREQREKRTNQKKST